MITIQFRSCLLLLLMFSSLTGKSQSNTALPAILQLHITNKFGEEEMKLDQVYTNFHGDKIILTKFKYYISNIELIKKDGTIWKQPQSYHLIEVNEETSATTEINLQGIPPGEYHQIAFAIGVDSISNHSGKQEGALDPDYGMFWMWETGYVFFKTEGMYQTPAGSKGAMVYHVGRDHCYKKISLTIPAKKLQFSPNTKNQLQVTADIKKLFGGFPGAAIDLKSPPDNSSISVMSGEKAAKVANNYAQMFSIGN